MPQIRCVYQGSKYIKDPDAANRQWGVHRFYSSEIGDFIATGNLFAESMQSNMDMILFGDWVDNDYGRQFRFSNHALCYPAGKEGMVALLSSAPGIGKITAEKIWEAYGEESARKIAASPEALKPLMPGRGHRWSKWPKYEEVSEFIRKRLAEIECQLPLITVLSGIAFPKDLPEKIIAKMIPDPVGTIKKNPFWLTQFSGCGFYRCDQLRMKLMLPHTMPERYKAAVMQVFYEKNSEVWIHKNLFLHEAANFLQVSAESIRKYINELVKDGSLKFYKDHLALASTAGNEMDVCRLLVQYSDHAKAYWPNMSDDPNITQHQIDEAHRAFSNGRIAFLLGSAGTGKTRTAAAIMQKYKNVMACAPTGKAAQRLGWALRNQGVTDIIPMTVHRMLGATPVENEWKFAVDGIDSQIDADLVVVDECSMLDNYLANCLLKAISDNTPVLMLGDPHQLPPVGRGTLLRDWPEWCKEQERFTYGLLTEIHRNAGLIAQVCLGIRKRDISYIETSRFIASRWDTEHNLQMVDCDTGESAQFALLEFVNQMLGEEGVWFPNDTRVDPIKDFQVVTATNSGSPASKDELNKLLQDLLNPIKYSEHPVFRPGDRVMCTVNSRFRLATPEGRVDTSSPEVYVANGEQGLVIQAFEKRIVIETELNPGKHLYIPCGAAGTGFDLAYCCTVHKFQGSQARIVAVILMDDYKSKMVSGVEFAYTALTRAEELCILLSTNDILRDTCRRVHIWDRKSFMIDWLTECSGHGRLPVSSSD